ncbi:extracellular solute-binding protein [Georgenia halophila]|uniref:Extracellular solute-binding protein n=1 Tax=Georgenia halophila TaxID=620889 RepID=A0ABP8LNG5_9MICO
MKKHLIATTAALSLTLAACSSGGGGETDDGADGGAPPTGPITVWFSNNEFELEWGNALVEEWNADHPDAQVEAQEIPAGSSSEEAITAAITAGTAPCLVYNISPAAAPQWQAQGGLVDLSQFDGAEQYLSERSGDDTLGQYRGQDGGIYQVPWKSNPVMVMYNKEVFQQAGLDPENPDMNTFDSFLDGARDIVSSGAAETAIWPSPTTEFYQPWFDFYPTYLATTGGTSLVEDGAATFDDDNGMAVWEFWRTFYEEGLTSQEAATEDAMTAGTTAMQMAGPWAIASYEGQVDYGFMPVPTEDGVAPEETYTFADAKNVSMFTSCENTGTAWEFLQLSTSEAADGDLLEATGQMPLRTGLTDAYPDYFEANPNYVAFADQAERTVDVPNIPNSVEAWQTFREEWSRSVIFDEVPVADGLQAAADAVNGLVQE